MAAARSQSPSPPKYGFTGNIWIADENGNIYYIVSDPSHPDRLQGTRVATIHEKWDFQSRDELVNANLIKRPRPGVPDASVAIVKMLLTLGVTTAAIPKGIVYDKDYSVNGMSYVINLASFDRANVFWPDDSIKPTMIEIKAHK